MILDGGIVPGPLQIFLDPRLTGRRDWLCWLQAATDTESIPISRARCSMPIDDRLALRCPHCDKSLSLKREDYKRFIGRAVPCPHCRGQMQIADFPGLYEPAPPPVPQSQPAAPVIDIVSVQSPKSQTAVSSQPATSAGPAKTKECPYCAERIAEAAKKCRYCGEIVDVTLLAATRQQSGRRKDPGIAGLLSFFWTGTGHIYAEETTTGIVLMLVTVVCAVLDVFTCVFIFPHLAFAIWVIFDAVRATKKYNQEHGFG